MPTRKVGEVDWSKFRPCSNPDHDVPSMMVFQPGVYEHECPGCKNIIRFTVRPTHYLQVEHPANKVPVTVPRPEWARMNIDRWD